MNTDKKLKPRIRRKPIPEDQRGDHKLIKGLIISLIGLGFFSLAYGTIAGYYSWDNVFEEPTTTTNETSVIETPTTTTNETSVIETPTASKPSKPELSSDLEYPEEVMLVLAKYDYDNDGKIEFLDQDNPYHKDGISEFAVWSVDAGMTPEDADIAVSLFMAYDKNGDWFWDQHEIDSFFIDYYKSN